MKCPNDMHHREQRLIEGLRERGYKLTSQRLEIIRQLAHDPTHPGASDLLRKVRKTVPRVSMSTVYYTLDMLKKEGLIRELEYYDMDNRYDANVSDHINLICTKCKKITDFMRDLSAVPKAVEKASGFKPARMRYEYYGICKKCMK